MIETLLQKPYWIIDILPKQVPPESSGQYFAVEQFILREPQLSVLRMKQASLILKLNCYYDILVEGEMNPAPECVVSLIRSRCTSILLEDALLTTDPYDTYMTLYNPDTKLLELVITMAASEGLFVWQPPQRKDGDGQLEK